MSPICVNVAVGQFSVSLLEFRTVDSGDRYTLPNLKLRHSSTGLLERLPLLENGIKFVSGNPGHSSQYDQALPAIFF